MQRNILEYLEESGANFPDKVVFADDRSSITYGELIRQARFLGACLLERREAEGGCAPVAIFIDRSIASLTGFFGVVYSGDFYVPIDRQMPAARIELILHTLNPAVILGEEKDKRILAQMDMEDKLAVLAEILASGKDFNLNEEQEKALDRVRRTALDTDPLYSIFTSGSTGVPKGVLVSHRSVIDLIDNFKEEFAFSEDCIFGNQAPFDFDVSVKDI